jgi:hypothetical protein
MELLEGKSSLFFCEQNSHASEPLADIVPYFASSYRLPVIYMHWGEPPAHPTGNSQAAFLILPISRNFTSTLISLGKLLADKQHIIFMNDFQDIAHAVDRKPFYRFLVILLNKCRERHSTLLAAFRGLPDSVGYEADMNRLFDNVFRIDVKNIQRIEGNGQAEKSYSFSGKELTTVHSAQTDVEKIREIFRLTPEEQKELDVIASRQIREFIIP